jgi:peptidoglycan/LPS O-acetylase OafA/YrhL
MADMGGSHHFGGSKSEPRRIMNSNIALEDQFDAANVGRPAGNIQEAVHGLASKKHYAPALDGLRAICIIFTILYHMPGCPRFINGTIGVDIFFALSGWLITWLLLEEQGRRAGGLNLRAFYIRRVFRIMPIYYVTIMLYVIATLVLSRMSGDIEKIDNLRVAIGYLLTFNREYAPPGARNFISHAWTLGIEEKFYLIWPAILFVFARSALNTFAVSAAVIVTTVVVFGSYHLVLPGYLGLGFGATLAFWSYYNHGVRKTFERYPIASLAALALAVPYTLSLDSPSYGWNICISAISSVMIASIWLRPSQPVARALSLPPLRWLGTLTFSIYMLHVLCMNLVLVLFAKLHVSEMGVAFFICTYAVSVLVAWLANAAVELPMISLGKRLALHAGSAKRVVV